MSLGHLDRCFLNKVLLSCAQNPETTPTGGSNFKLLTAETFQGPGRASAQGAGSARARMAWHCAPWPRPSELEL